MKKCLQCNRSYSDETLSFCLDDGALLSAFYNPQETQAPTVAINAPEIPTVFANEIPAVAAQELPETVAASAETQTAFNAAVNSAPASNPPVRWHLYLLGFVAALIVYQVEVYLIMPTYLEFTEGIFEGIGDLIADGEAWGSFITSLISILPLHLFIFGLLGYVFGLIWSKTGGKWGYVLVLPVLIYRIYYCLTFKGDLSDFLYYFVSSLVTIFILFIGVSYLSFLGSRYKSNDSQQQMSQRVS
jgi:hypothetical protein